MTMRIHKTGLEGVLVIEPTYHRDARGFFVETWHRERYREIGVPTEFAQDNVSASSKGVLRGLHFQNPKTQGKLVTVLQGEIFDVAVDIRAGSKTFGEWYGAHLSEENGKQLWIPPGFAHGFCVTSEKTMVSYKCTDLYHPEHEVSLLWNDADIGVQWPKLSEYSLSEKDKNGIPLKSIQALKP